MKKIAKYLGCGLVIVVMLAAVLTYLGPHIGWQVDAVLSGSMDPELEVGSLVVTRFVEPEEIAVGDIITFSSGIADKNQITHRVVGIGHSSAIYFETKGDANDAPDPNIVLGWNLIGKVIFTVSYWGYITEFIKTPFGFLLALVIPGAVIIAGYAIAIWKFIVQRKNGKMDETVEEKI